MYFLCLVKKMKKTLILSDLYNIAAIVINNKIQEFVFSNRKHQINNIYIGLVNKIFPSINAAFVDLDQGSKSGFIHFSDLSILKRRSNNTKFSNDLITDILKNEQKILVQITKEATISKGPRLTSNISIIGKYMVLMPFSKNISVPRTIKNINERSYLKSLGILIKPTTMGLVFRSSIIGISEDIILAELHNLKKQWFFIQKLALKCTPPYLLYNDNNLTKRIIRDYFDNNTRIIIDSQKSFYSICKYLYLWKYSIDKKNKFLELLNIDQNILDLYFLSNTLFTALNKKVELPLGGYIILETLEALTVIDVNSGAFNKSSNSKETIYKINLSAAKEIAYQLKIRNIAGLVIIDFIDMQSQREQLHLLEYFCKYLSLDNIKSQIVQLSELGLVELTRKRRGKSLHELSEVFTYDLYSKIFNSYNSFNKIKNDFDLDNLIYYFDNYSKFFYISPSSFHIFNLLNIDYSSYKLSKFKVNIFNSSPKVKYFRPIIFYSSILSHQRYSLYSKVNL
uniref:Ribonuclease E n=1 Tax=Compsopogon caeruleus TaxID=31354 RepID=A0A1Z1XBF4_9RHOD|nr:ribonuclease E [Compsopogon caeruleus]ARX96156.1 ribonuclease E [Compsopogon caeruleus]